jgi:2-polyprenyl-3-methyl-5-hydroxy-6-metoxy-1,4-benzoquinol methylase
MTRTDGRSHNPGGSLLRPLPRRQESELLDDQNDDRAELAENFRDIRRVNRLLGGVSTTTRYLPRLLATIPPGRTVTVLDLATGCGDIPLAILRWARRRGVSVEIIASDVDEVILELARQHTGGFAEITFACHDARNVPLPDRSVDIVLCALSLHHFDPDDAVRVLGEMDRIARYGFILNDLRRDRLGYAAAWIAARLGTRNRLTRNDAPLSVLRAYTPMELEALLRRARITNADISTHRWFRMAAVSTRGAING